MKDKVDSYVSMANFQTEDTTSIEDDNRQDHDPPKWEELLYKVPIGEIV